MSGAQIQAQVAAALAAFTESITLTHATAGGAITVNALVTAANAAQVTEFLGSHSGTTANHPAWLLTLDGTQTLPERGDQWTRDHYPLVIQGVDVQRVGGTVVCVTALAVPSSLPTS